LPLPSSPDGELLGWHAVPTLPDAKKDSTWCCPYQIPAARSRRTTPSQPYSSQPVPSYYLLLLHGLSSGPRFPFSLGQHVVLSIPTPPSLHLDVISGLAAGGLGVVATEGADVVGLTEVHLRVDVAISRAIGASLRRGVITIVSG
jgi:hypothetical protein